MGKLKKAGMLVIAASMLAFVAGGAAGCSNAMIERSSILEDKITNTIVQMDDTVRDFKFTGADVDKTGFKYDVSFNGIASLEGEEKAFADLHYSVPHSVFMNLKKDSYTNEVYDVFDYIVDNLKPEELNLTKVGDIQKFNDAIIKNTPATFEGYKVARGFVYNLEDPSFDDENRTVSFDVKTILEFKKGTYQPGFGLGLGFGGGVGPGLGLGIYSEAKQGTFTTIDNYTVSFSEEDYQYIKSDPTFVYEVVANAIERQDGSMLKVKRENTNDVTYDNADLLSKINFNDAVAELDI